MVKIGDTFENTGYSSTVKGAIIAQEVVGMQGGDITLKTVRITEDGKRKTVEGLSGPLPDTKMDESMLNFGIENGTYIPIA